MESLALVQEFSCFVRCHLSEKYNLQEELCSIEHSAVL